MHQSYFVVLRLMLNVLSIARIMNYTFGKGRNVLALLVSRKKARHL